MNWAWATSLDYIWRSSAFPMWVTLAAAGFFGILVLITLLRAEKSVANGALTVITLLAVGIAVAATIRGYGPLAPNAPNESRSPQQASAASSAISCADDLAGDTVLMACEKVLFGSAEQVASALSQTAAQLDRLVALGDVAIANRSMTPELKALRRTLEHDRYGLVAQVLLARDRCTPSECAAFRVLTDNRQILVNMDNHLYDVLVARYASSWNAPPPAAAPVAALGPSVPTGRPTNADFPSSSSIPPVSIMTAEPGTGGSKSTAERPASPAANAQAAAPRPAAAEPAKGAAAPPAAVKKQAAQKQPTRAPTPLSPPPTGAAPPDAAND
jgi:hypothetical protein